MLALRQVACSPCQTIITHLRETLTLPCPYLEKAALRPRVSGQQTAVLAHKKRKLGPFSWIKLHCVVKKPCAVHACIVDGGSYLRELLGTTALPPPTTRRTGRMLELRKSVGGRSSGQRKAATNTTRPFLRPVSSVTLWWDPPPTFQDSVFRRPRRIKVVAGTTH